MGLDIVFSVTHAGKNAALDADGIGLNLKLPIIRFGNGHGPSDQNQVNLASVKVESSMSAGGLQESTNSLILGVNITSNIDVEVSEVGIFTDDGVLFAIARLTEGKYFTLSKDIPFIGSFGLRLGDIDNVEISVMYDAPIAQQMMIDHETHPNPHPQYSRQLSELQDYITNQLQQLINEITESNEAFQTEIYSQLSNFQQQINEIIDRLNAITYPRTVACGVVAGTASETTPFIIPVPSSIDDLRDNKYLIHVTPEGHHEGWTLIREQKQFKLNVWTRSGQNRIGYSGALNWSIIQSSGETIGLNGEYTQGRYNITIPKNTTAFIQLVGGGGGGGMSVHQDEWLEGYSANGSDGGDTYLMLADDLIATGKGGGGGKLGWWDNGSTWTSGTGGLGGTAIGSSTLIESSLSTTGKKGNSERDNNTGGASISPVGNYGEGGEGGKGIGNNNDGWSGGGGSGGYYQCTIQAKDTPLFFTLIVGSGGAGGLLDTQNEYAEQNKGKNGKGGFAKITLQT